MRYGEITVHKPSKLKKQKTGGISSLTAKKNAISKKKSSSRVRAPILATKNRKSRKGKSITKRSKTITEILKRDGSLGNERRNRFSDATN